jgi:hypothetical protein
METPAANAFTTKPYLSASPTTAGIILKFKPRNGGKYYGVIANSLSAAAQVNLAEIKSPGANVNGHANCQKTNQALVGTNVVTVQFNDCTLTQGASYKVFIYVDDSNTGIDDGTLESFEFAVPSGALTNKFNVYPIVSGGTASSMSLPFTLTPNGNGKVWMVVVPSEQAGGVDIDFIKNQTDPMIMGYNKTDPGNSNNCAVKGESVSAGTGFGRTLTDCAMYAGAHYRMVAYVSDATGDGGEIVKNQGGDIFIPLSNTLKHGPSLKTGTTATGNAISFNFMPSDNGKAW